MRFSGLFVPKTVQEAIEAFERANGAAFYVNGGTDVLVVAREKDRFDGKLAIDLSNLAELKELREETDTLLIGAGCTHARIAADPLVRRYASVLAAASSEVGSPQIRNRGTLGGNIANASPAADTLGPLALHRARLLLRGPQGARECALGELVTAPYRNALLPGELIEAVRIDKLDCPQRFFKLGRRRALAISRLAVSVSGRLTDGRIDDLRVALGSAFPRPMCFPEITEAVQGERPTPELLRRIAAQTAAKLPEIAGVRASTLYKQPVSQKLLERLLGELFEVQYG